MKSLKISQRDDLGFFLLQYALALFMKNSEFGNTVINSGKISQKTDLFRDQKIFNETFISYTEINLETLLTDKHDAFTTTMHLFSPPSYPLLSTASPPSYSPSF